MKILGTEQFLTGSLPVQSLGYLFFAAGNISFGLYLFFTHRLVRSIRIGNGAVSYIVPLSVRERWSKQLLFSFALLLVVVTAYFISVIIGGTYSPTASYVYTLTLSAITYVIAYRLVLNPDLISPDFAPKYKTYGSFVGMEREAYLQKLQQAMESEKVYLNADLKLPALSKSVGLPPHQLSRLINETFGKTFNDYVNEYRVQEFVRRANSAEYQAHSIYGIALDVGFNSKSSFNVAFRKITGKTPSELRNTV
jgi:AraC-like DNA-binding protein